MKLKRFRLERVGAGPGTAVFTCDQLLGASVDVVDAAEVAAVERDAARYRLLRERPEFNRDAGRFEWYLPAAARDRRRDEPQPTLGERVDEALDAELEQLAAASRRAAVADQGFDDDDGGDEE